MFVYLFTVLLYLKQKIWGEYFYPVIRYTFKAFFDAFALSQIDDILENDAIKIEKNICGT